MQAAGFTRWQVLYFNRLERQAIQFKTIACRIRASIHGEVGQFGFIRGRIESESRNDFSKQLKIPFNTMTKSYLKNSFRPRSWML